MTLLPAEERRRFDGISRSDLERTILELEGKLAAAERASTARVPTKILADVVLERLRQDAKWGSLATRTDIPDCVEDRQDELAEVRAVAEQHCQSTGRTTCCWAHVLEEECLEALCAEDNASLRAELVQVAATAVLWIEVIDQRKDYSNEKHGAHHRDGT